MKKSLWLVLVLGLAFAVQGCGFDPTIDSSVMIVKVGISFSDVLNSYGDFRAGDASKTAVPNYEKKHNLKDGKPIETTTTTKTEENKDDVPAWAQALIDSNKNLSDKLTQFEAEKAQATRSQQILAKAKEYGIPENYAKRCAIKDDEDLDAYFKDLKQEFANDGFKGVVLQIQQKKNWRMRLRRLRNT